MKPIKNISSVILFGIPSVALLLLTRLLIPFLSNQTGLHPALSWFIAGSLIFVPLFLLAIGLARRDGYKTRQELTDRFRLKKMKHRDWKYVFISSLSILVITGGIMGISKLLHLRFGIPEIETAPSFMHFAPFEGNERFLLLVWLFMFFFNMYGEELFWRGYILPRQELTLGKKAWMLNSALWFIFHICFGGQLLILLVPILIILPYAVQKTRNTNVGLLIHAIINGPAFVMVALGVIG